MSRLLDGPGMATKTRRPLHENPLFPPPYFLDVVSGKESTRGKSKVNLLEVETALALFVRLQNDFPETDSFKYNVGVVTPVKISAEELETQFVNKVGPGILAKVAFNTVDVGPFHLHFEWERY